ncbi:MAG: hypothetical protein ACPGU9_07510 [Flavobacteriaceae bacterium]
MFKSYLVLFLLIINTLVFSQENTTIELKNIVELDADEFIGINMFDELFFVKNNTLHKHTSNENYAYKNIQLGDLDNVSIINSLQSSVFYKNFNTLVQLDKKFGELRVINFNQSINLSSVGYAATTNDKHLWIFNSDTQQLQIYNPRNDTIEVSTVPVQEPIIKFYSNYNFCWVLTATKLLQFNVYGNLLNEYALEAYDDFTYYNDFFVLKKENTLSILPTEATETQNLDLPEIPVKEFSVTNETLYIYTGKKLYSFTLNLK